MAARVDLRLPTGDENQLLGAGGTEAKFLLIASAERGRLGQHANLGYTVARGVVAGTPAGLASTSLPDEINYAGGIEFVATPRLTFVGDAVGRTLRAAGHLDVVAKPFQYRQFDPQTGLVLPSSMRATTFFDEFNPRPGHLTLLLGTAGAKWNLHGNLLLTGSVLFPRTNAGLRSRVTTVVGLDYAF